MTALKLDERLRVSVPPRALLCEISAVSGVVVQLPPFPVHDGRLLDVQEPGGREQQPVCQFMMFSPAYTSVAIRRLFIMVRPAYDQSSVWVCGHIG